MLRTSIFAFILFLILVTAERHALVFGTADYWSNYCITSEPCRVYDKLIQSGFKEENIIYMTFTSVLDFKLNPYPGMIFTSPAENTDGDWAKYGCFEHVDYTGFNEITKDTFLGIISGDKENVKKATGMENPKVLNAGPEDTVFAYYIDHGNVDVISVGFDYVQGYQIVEAIQEAHNKKLYGKWFWLFDACYSGSLFKELPSDIDFYVLTGADGHHEAEMNHCPPDDDVIAGKSLGTCLSALFEDSFLDYVDHHPDCTLGEAADFVKGDVAKSSAQTVSEYGDLSFRDLHFSEFVGTHFANPTSHSKSQTTSVTYSEVPTHLAKWRAIRSTDQDKEISLENYKKRIFEDARLEVESMRLGRKLLSEKEVDSAWRQTELKEYAMDCVRNLSVEFARECKHELPLPQRSLNIIRSICKVERETPHIDFNDICNA